MAEELENTEEINTEEENLDLDENFANEERQSEEEPKESIEDVSKRLEELQREKDGLYKEMMNERKTRQELKAQVDLVTKIISEAKGKRDVGEEPRATTVRGIPVKFNDDGDPYIDPADLDNLISPYAKDIKKDVSEVKNQAFVQALQSQNSAIIGDAISKDPRYPQAYNVLNNAFKWLDDQTGIVLRRHGINVNDVSLGDALDMLEKEGVADELSKQFPGLDIDTIVDAHVQGPDGLVNKRKLNKALKAVVSSSQKKGNNAFDQFKLIASKPNSLSGASNQKGAAGRTLNDIADMDLESLSDADFAKLERALAKAGV